MAGGVEFADEAVMIGEAEQEKPGGGAFFKQRNMLAAAEEIGADALEEDVVAGNRSAFGNAADEFAVVRIGDAGWFVARLGGHEDCESVVTGAFGRRCRRGAHGAIAREAGGDAANAALRGHADARVAAEHERDRGDRDVGGGGDVRRGALGFCLRG